MKKHCKCWFIKLGVCCVPACRQHTPGFLKLLFFTKVRMCVCVCVSAPQAINKFSLKMKPE